MDAGIGPQEKRTYGLTRSLLPKLTVPVPVLPIPAPVVQISCSDFDRFWPNPQIMRENLWIFGTDESRFAKNSLLIRC